MSVTPGIRLFCSILRVDESFFMLGPERDELSQHKDVVAHQFAAAVQLSRKAWLSWEKAGSSLLPSPGQIRCSIPAAASLKAGV